MKSKLVLFLAIVMGLFTTFLFYNYMQAYDQAKVVNTNMTEVVVAKEPIKKNQKISQNMVRVAQVPSNGVHPQAVRKTSEVEGVYALADIAVDETLLTHRLGTEREEKIFVSRKVQQGYRAVSVGLNFVQSVSNLIEPEDWVDVVFTEPPPKGQDQNMVNSYILLSKVRVLAIGRRMLEATAEDAYVEYSSVTLELEPLDAVKLINSSEKGNIQLILHTKVVPAKEASNNANQSSKSN